MNAKGSVATTRGPRQHARTLEEIFGNNDVQPFDLQSDLKKCASWPSSRNQTILRMNELPNDLIAKEVGVNDGRFLAQLIGPQ
jgi:hypothetical protein